MTPSELRRLCLIIRVFLAYGLDELIPPMRITLPLRIGRRCLFWMRNRHGDKPLGERLRLALQTLGPVWIKFGQMLSTRRDLFAPAIADQLALLQDRVAPFDGALARRQIEAALGGRWSNGLTILTARRWRRPLLRRCIPRRCVRMAERWCLR